MCLEVDQVKHPKLKPLIADKDIKCYKVIQFYSGELYTVMQGSVLKLQNQGFKIILKPDYFDAHPHWVRSIGGNRIRVISHGIHVYDSKTKANNLVCYFKSIPNIYMIPIIIPKGTQYWIGVNHDLCAEYIQFPDNWKDYLK